MSGSSSPTPSLPPPQGYVAEKVSIVLGALRSALRRVGLAVTTVDDSLVPLEDKIKEPGQQDGSPRLHSPSKVPGLHSIGHKVDQVLQDAAEFKDSHAAHVAHDAMLEDRLHRDRRIEL
ncbi:hypothetical protein OEZ85_003634 [Tetradesmus obliquus]|uniref:Uncharacterized protein n=1 Tax=Tetradesmus obliquus TaxID=3088 RepID=A0ABY8UCR8_TETOB|nr:hypothetical protein OEZ85_003634 [Tetradesmus obliquus]